MDKKRLLTLMGGMKKLVPYSVDFSTLANGSLPSRFTGATWSIATGVAINTPTEGSELLTNGNMESGDPVDNWTSINLSTGASVADERTGGAGSKSMEVTAGSAFGSMRQQVTAAKGAWLKTGFWYKKGSSNGFVAIMSFNAPAPVDVAWTEYLAHGYVPVANPYLSLGCVTNTGTSRYDDASCKLLTSIYSGIKADTGLQTVKATVTLTAPYIPIGVFMCGNSESPTSGVFATVNIYSGNFIAVRLWKLVNTTYTELSVTNIAQIAGSLLEIRRTAATTFQIWYNGTQRGTDQTISDAEIINNTYAGMLSTGGTGNSIGAFFLV